MVGRADRPGGTEREGRPVRQQRGLAGWPAVALVSVAFVVTMLGTTLPTPLYPLYAAKFGFSEFMTTVIFAVYAVGVIAGLLLFGHWSDQLGRRPLLLAGLLLSAASAGVYLLPGALGWIFAGRLLSGLSAGIFTGTATASIVDLAPEGSKARAGLIAAAVNMGGLGLGPLVAGILAQYSQHPLSLPFAVDLIAVAVGLVCVLLIRDPVRRAERPNLKPRPLKVPSENRSLFTRAAIAGFAGFAVLGLFSAVSAAFLGQVLHRTSHVLVGLVVIALFLASMVGQVVSSALASDRALLLGSAVLAAGALIIAAALPLKSLPLLIAGAVVAGLGQGASFRAGLSGVAGATPEDRRSQVTSTLFTALYVGISLPVVGVGALAAATSLIAAGLIFSVIVAALGVVAVLLLRRSAEDGADPVGGRAGAAG